MRYKVELIKSEEGYAVGCPELPGCWSQGNTEEEALANIKSAITEYLEVVEEMNRRKETRYVEVLASRRWENCPASTTCKRSKPLSALASRSFARADTSLCPTGASLSSFHGIIQ